ncbi:MAG: hypothetical protein A3I24_04195 [Candidatus Harrisonbacteria bacterium RIFCSPLOWO2_02_FULL_41_13b]|uniref:Heat-inducible transcription repressor HrcA C-terminal domain-containing protein n=1 Tax=Candidatus Harrisonbacteria bacterium RIFCSPLOWO2_02_FULL_41_13b TaxID=1798409 RepID=A0A1G1ZSX7_9BACT|nr:MAG: hypothetical protein A3J53_01525 [Candidatus Harrisonbacteria bacterium RIFCSPHIGHO2_02_FULL_40_20]OGY66860.1 MAG: hypothetical protein A3I24_04195 [Candidatus Harrisonbacteria bacterium RIFCSPLOWO2_02_FULL_41_13b]
MLKDRPLSILEAVVRDFINTGVPVSSKRLFQDHGFEIKPATIRAELNQLTESGFLSQPHTSGGRIPTDKAYRLFAEHFVATPNPNFNFPALENWLRSKMNKFIDEVSEELRILSVGYNPRQQEVYKSGLDDLVGSLDFENKKDIFEVVSDFEMIDERVNSILNYLDNRPKVFIGKSPITKSQNLSVVAGRYKRGEDPLILIAIGPKRMDYEKVIQLFKALNNDDE